MTRAIGLLAMVVLGLVLVLSAVPRAQSKAETALRAAIETETVKGDLKSAIEQYKSLAAGSDRAVAAKALVHLGECYQKQGNAESTKAWQRVVRDFADQKEAAADAQKRLAAAQTGSVPETGLVERHSWTLPDGTELPTLSPDGRFIARVMEGDQDTRVVLHDLVTGDDRTVADKTHCYQAWLSPDGKQIGCNWSQGNGTYEIRVLPLDGSATRTLFATATEAGMEAWSPDGKRILARIKRERTSPGPWDMVLISVSDGSIQVLKSGGGIGPGPRSFGLRFSPDGLYVVHPASRVDSTGKATAGITLHVMSSDGSREVPLVQGAATENDWNPAWTPDGRRIVFLSDRSGTPSLWSIRVIDGKPQGDPEFVKTQSDETLGFTRDGTFYSLRTVSLSDIYVADLDVQSATASPPKQVNKRWVGNATGPLSWSPDGNVLVFNRMLDGQRRLVVHALDSGEERDLPSPVVNETPSLVVGWFPDSQWLLAGNPLRRVDVTTGQVQPIPKLERSIWDKFGTGTALSHDGKTIFYPVSDNDSQKNGGRYTVHLVRQRLDTGEQKELYQTTSALPALHSIAASPDGRLVAFGEMQEQGSVLKVIAVDGGPAHQVLDYRFSLGVAWSKDSRFVLARGAMTGHDVQLLVVPADGGPARATGLRMGIWFALHPDGRRLAFGGGSYARKVIEIKNLLPGPAASRTATKQK